MAIAGVVLLTIKNNEYGQFNPLEELDNNLTSI